MTAQELKNSILQLAIQGKLVKQNPNDEPASVLLEKIKEEREKLIKEKKIKREKYSEIYKDPSDNHYYEKFEDGTINDITEEIPFEIPDSWNFIRFNNLVNYKMGKTPPRGEKSFWSNDYNWVSISDMIDGKEINETKEMVSQKAYVNIFNNDISPKGTLLMSFKLTIGKVSILDIDSFHNEAIISIYPYFDNNYILRDYLFKILPLISNYGNTKNAIKGKTLNSKSINELIIPITNFNELSKIIKKIDYFEPILENFESKFIELDKLNNSYKEELKKSILQYAIQGKLVSQNPNDESAEVLINKILEEKRELTKTKQIKKENLSVIYKDDTDNQFYEKFDDGTIVNITDEITIDIPQNWRWVRLKNIVYNHGQKKPDTTFSYIDIGTLDNINHKLNENENIIESNQAPSRARKIVKKGDVLYSTVRPYLHNICVVDKDFSKEPIASTGFAVLTCLTGIYNKYLFYLLLTPFFDSYANSNENAKGVAYPAINDEKLYKALIPIPPRSEQKKIVDKLEKVFNIIG